MLDSAEKQSVVKDMADLIRATGDTAEIIRPSVVSAGDFAGPHEPSVQSIGTVPIEFKQLSPEDLKQVGADGICSMLPDVDVAEGDIVIYNGDRYRVTDINPANCFGAITHLIVKLEREYQQQS